ncbi:MAG: O-antigen ligase family protein [Salinibacterium sp.]|nr:MAG: O-antigen ligase family protein [Salinibacterium sp.]
MRIVDNPGARFAYLLVALTCLLAGDALRFTFGWWAFGILSGTVVAVSVWLLIVQRARWRLSSLPYPFIAFLLLATASIAWSAYRPETALGLMTTWWIASTAVAAAVTFSWAEIVRAMSIVVRVILGLSLAFELFVSLVLRHPILPFNTQPGVDYSQYKKIPLLLYWSRDQLFDVFHEGRIQGILGNANNLGVIALIGLVVFAIQTADRSIRRRWGVLWIAVALATLVFTRSGTITVALVVVCFVTLAVLLVRRAQTPRARALTYGGLLATVAIGAVAATAWHGAILQVLGKSADLTGRVGIWQSVIGLAQQHPVFGWGWVSFWMPWAAPFDNLAFRNGVRQLQAHDAWLDLWFQLGIVGVVVFALLALTALGRSWALAVDRRQTQRDHAERYDALSLFPLLMLVLLLVQSVAESRLLVEYGLFLLVVIAVKTKRSAQSPDEAEVPARAAI